MAIAGSNMDHDNRASQISVESLNFKNFDPEAYQNDKELEKEKQELQLENAQIEKVDEGKYHPADMLMIDVKTHMEEQNRKALTFLSDRDPKQQILFKHFKVIQGYERAFDEFIKKINDY